MSGGDASPTLGTVVVACVAVAVIRLPMVVTSGVFAVGVALVGDFDIGVPQAIGLAVLAWPLWAVLLVAGQRLLAASRDGGTTRIDVVALQCLATAGSLLVSSVLVAGDPAGGLAYGLVVAAVMCVIEVLGLTGGRPFSTDWRAPTACSLQHRNATDQSEFGRGR